MRASMTRDLVTVEFKGRENIAGWRLLGRNLTFEYHDVLVPFTLLLRLSMAWIFLWAGFDKLIGGFSASSFLQFGTSGPFQSFWVSLGESQTAVNIINPIVVTSQILMGFALLLGVVTRFTLFGAGVQMFLFYISQFPPEHDLFLDYYLVYIVVYMLLGALGAGRVLGADRYIEQWAVVRRLPVLRYLLG